MDRFISFTDEMRFSTALEAFDLAYEALSISGSSVIVPTNEYDRLRDAGLLTKLDDIKTEAKALKKAHKHGNGDPAEIKKRAGELIKSLTELKADINKIPSDPSSEKNGLKIAYVIMAILLVVVAAVTGFMSVKSSAEFKVFEEISNANLENFRKTGKNLFDYTAKKAAEKAAGLRGARAAAGVSAAGTAIGSGALGKHLFSYVDMKKKMITTIDKLIAALRLIQGNPGAE